MQTRTRTGRFVYAVLIAACVLVLSSGAMGGYFRSTDSGQSRELINRPVCWTAESYNDIRRCELDDRL